MQGNSEIQHMGKESFVDKSIARAFRKYLCAVGFVSCMTATSWGDLHYYDSSPGSCEKPLVLIHGLGSSAQSWWVLAQMIVNKKRIVMPDLFHMCGFSVPNNPGMNFFQHAGSVVEFIKKITPHPVDLCGISLGGWIALHIAAHEKKLVHKLVLLNPAGLKIKTFELRDSLTFLNWEKFQSLYPGMLKAFPFTGIFFLSAAFRRSLFRGLNTESIKSFLNSTKAEHFIDDQLKNIECEVLLLWGKEDKFLSQRIPEILTQKIKQIQAKYIEHCAHVLPLEAPVNVFLEINEFLNLKIIVHNQFTKVLLSLLKQYSTETILKNENQNDY